MRHPLYKTLSQEFALAFTGEYLTNKLFLLGEPTDLFTPGSRGGRSTVSALRFSQEWVKRSPVQVIAAFSRFSIGLDVLGATGKDTTVPNSADSRRLNAPRGCMRLRNLCGKDWVALSRPKSKRVTGRRSVPSSVRNGPRPFGPRDERCRGICRRVSYAIDHAMRAIEERHKQRPVVKVGHLVLRRMLVGHRGG